MFISLTAEKEIYAVSSEKQTWLIKLELHVHTSNVE